MGWQMSGATVVVMVMRFNLCPILCMSNLDCKLLFEMLMSVLCVFVCALGYVFIIRECAYRPARWSEFMGTFGGLCAHFINLKCLPVIPLYIHHF